MIHLTSSMRSVRTLSLSANPITAESPLGWRDKLNGSSENALTNSHCPALPINQLKQFLNVEKIHVLDCKICFSCR